MKVDGKCHCGNIKYTAEVDPAHVRICHCTDCQSLSGTAFRVVIPAKAGSFRLVQGEPRIYVKVAESGNPREQSFCENCGSPIYSAPVGPEPKVVSLRVGTLSQRRDLQPCNQIWYRSALPWLEDLREIERMEKQPQFDPRGGFTSGR